MFANFDEAAKLCKASDDGHNHEGWLIWKIFGMKGSQKVSLQTHMTLLCSVINHVGLCTLFSRLKTCKLYEGRTRQGTVFLCFVK